MATKTKTKADKLSQNSQQNKTAAFAACCIAIYLSLNVNAFTYNTHRSFFVFFGLPLLPSDSFFVITVIKIQSQIEKQKH